MIMKIIFSIVFFFLVILILGEKKMQKKSRDSVVKKILKDNVREKEYIKTIERPKEFSSGPNCLL